MTNKLSKVELKKQLLELQAQLNESPEWEIGQEVFTSRGLAKVAQYYTEDGIDKIQCLFTQLDTRDMLTLLDAQHLMSMPLDVFRAIIADHQMDQEARKVIIQQETTKQEYIEFLKYKREQATTQVIEVPVADTTDGETL